MATIALCPRCRTQLGLPAEAADAAEMQCPVCEGRFTLSSTAVHELPIARVAAPEPVVADHAWTPSGTYVNGVAGRKRSPDDRATAEEAAKPPDRPPSDWSDADSAYDKDSLGGDSQGGESPSSETSRLEELLGELPTDAEHGEDPQDAARAGRLVTVEHEPTNADFEDDFAAHELEGEAHDESYEHEPIDEEHEVHESEFESQRRRRRHREFPLRPSPKKRPRASTARMLVGAVIGGFAGLMLGGYALLWLSGPNLDVFYMASWLPKTMLPASVRMAAEEAARTTRQTTSTPTEPVEDAADGVADDLAETAASDEESFEEA